MKKSPILLSQYWINQGVVVTVNTVENTILDTIYYEIVELRIYYEIVQLRDL